LAPLNSGSGIEIQANGAGIAAFSAVPGFGNGTFQFVAGARADGSAFGHSA
jgi:hypothetical protein